MRLLLIWMLSQCRLDWMNEMTKYIGTHRFALVDANGDWVMTTEVREPTPVGDVKFWNRFMDSDLLLKYVGNGIEEIQNEIN